jgi:hypothetical protein
MPLDSNIVTADGTRTVHGKPYPDPPASPLALLVIWPAACRLRSAQVRVSSAAPDLYVYLFDFAIGGAGEQPAVGNMISRSELVPAGSGGTVDFREEGTRDALLGGYPFAAGCLVAATPNPEFDAADLFSDPYLDSATARVQIEPLPCSPELTAIGRVAAAVEQQLRIASSAQQNAQSAQPIAPQQPTMTPIGGPNVAGRGRR